MKSYKKRSSKKSIKRRSASKRSSSMRSASKRSSSMRSASKRSSSIPRKTLVKSHYRMRGMGHLLQMYGGASAELEAEHSACLVKYKDLISTHEEIKKSISDLRANGDSKSAINEQIMKANAIREEVRDLVDGVSKCKEKQAALLENLKDVTSNVTEQLNNQMGMGQAGGSAADIGAKLDVFGQKAVVASKNLSAGINAGISSLGASIKDKYNTYKDNKALQKRVNDLSYCKKNFSKDELSSESLSSESSV